MESLESQKQSSGLVVPILTLTSSDGKTGLLDSEIFQASANRMITKARRDAVQGEQVLNVALQDTFTTRALWVMLTEAENHIKHTGTTENNQDEGLLPQGWAPALLSLINKAETQIINARANTPARSSARLLPTTTPPPNGRLRPHTAVPPPRFVMVAAALRRSVSDNSDLPLLRELARERERKNNNNNNNNRDSNNELVQYDYRYYYFADHFRALAELQIEIRALVAVIQAEQMRVVAALSKQPKPKPPRRTTTTTTTTTSAVAFLSVLAEETDMLTTMQTQIANLFVRERPDDVGGEEIVLEQKLDALPVQLQAVFNMQCREREQERQRSSSRCVPIDERTMLRIVTENQKRTEIFRNIQRILADKREIRRHMSLSRVN